MKRGAGARARGAAPERSALFRSAIPSRRWRPGLKNCWHWTWLCKNWRVSVRARRRWSKAGSLGGGTWLVDEARRRGARKRGGGGEVSFVPLSDSIEEMASLSGTKLTSP